jgi:mono/diheme cytochrome c family protein
VTTRSGRSRTSRATYVVAALTAGLLAAGCGAVKHMTPEDGSVEAGKPLFKQHCASCHVLADADAAGTLGPNLDAHFSVLRKQGFDESTMRDVVRGQIAYPETETAEGGPGMPANLVEGQQARDVADYVAVCAGIEGACPGDDGE